MKQKIDLDTWERKEHFLFFNQFEEPYYGVCVTMDCTGAYRFAKDNQLSFFLYTMYLSLTAAQRIKEFTYRIEDGNVYAYNRIDGGSTVARPNGTFGFGFYPYHTSLTNFMQSATLEVADVQNRTDLIRPGVTNLIRYSSLPWIDFTSLSHARMFSVPDSAPRISFGKITGLNGKRTFPVSIHVHHALVDGLHVGQYINLFQQLMNDGV